MKLCIRHKRFAAQRVNQAADSKKIAADQFRQRHIDAALRRALAGSAEKPANPRPLFKEVLDTTP